MELYWLKLLCGKYSLITFNFISKVVKADQLFDYTDIFDENMTISADFPQKNAADTKCCYLLHLEHESCILGGVVEDAVVAIISL